MHLKVPILSIIMLFLGMTLNGYAQQHLIPLPTEVTWHQASLSLENGIHLRQVPKSLAKEFALAQSIISSWEGKLQSSKIQNKKALKKKPHTDIPTFILSLKPANTENTTAPKAMLEDESYTLLINEKGIHIQATQAKGIFYGLQTLKQFVLANGHLPYCTIHDKPAFAWRGFLVDVGRNYQSMELLKEQVDMMAQYKLNVLHFHFTEDLAWRLASKKHPGLTAASNMKRWKGDFYSEAEFKDLVNYCQERHIMLLPEIDMPGHSAAFERYFGVNMQSDSGMAYIKELLQEFTDTYPNLPYLHIGGDEVKIRNKNFMPEITKFVEDLGYKTMAWDPGSNILPSTIRQQWMGGPQVIPTTGDIKYIDSKHLYINHMDPIETVTTLFFRQLGAADRGHSNLLGAILCAWPDRAVAEARDMFLQNAIYPSMIAFGERSWRGGGLPHWVANLPAKGTPEYASFTAFESRLLDHKNRYFKELPFPYVKHSQLTWELIGPYNHEGDPAKHFPIEDKPFDKTFIASDTVYGGTIILRHWWNDVIKGALAAPQEHTTWYARGRFWSEKAGLQPFWIGFQNLSRSYESDSPKEGTWDNKASKLWVNGQIIQPPKWKQPGLVGRLEKPLLDEGYSFREPTLIAVKKGWNNVFIKIPAPTFAGENWQNPMKWMFSFMPLETEKNSQN